MDDWKDHYIAQCQVLVYKVFLEKWRRVPDGVLRGYCRGTRKLGELGEYCRVVGRWSCVIDHGFLRKINEFPLP
jgi:hypothetical protein